MTAKENDGEEIRKSRGNEMGSRQKTKGEKQKVNGGIEVPRERGSRI